MARPRLDAIWWRKNRPDALSTSAIQQALDDFSKVSRTLEKSGDVGGYFKAISRVKAAIAKDCQVLRKAKDKDGLKLLSELEKQAHSQSQAKQKQLTIKSDFSMSGLSGLSGTKVSEVAEGNSLSQIVNGKDRTWTLVKANQLANAKSKYCQALPKGISARDLTGWCTEKLNWTGTVRSLGDFTALTVQFRLEYDWGGHPTPGGGAFLNHCRIWVADLRAPWGFTVDAEVQVGKPFNAGSKKSPIGAIPLKLTLQVATSLDRTSSTWTVQCHGDKKREVK